MSLSPAFVESKLAKETEAELGRDLAKGSVLAMATSAALGLDLALATRQASASG